jgi:HAD superfamily hydrolase (TIGR01549 family)
MSYTCHLFDVDGTLVDTAPVILAALSGAIRESGYKDFSPDSLRERVMESPVSVLKGYGITSLYHYWRIYEKEYHKAQVFFPDTRATLLDLREKVKYLGVVSSLKNRQLDLLLRSVDLIDVFDIIVGWNDCNARKPSPQPILLALSRLNVPPSSATYTGDRQIDITAANRAGVLPLFAGWNSKEKISGHALELRTLKDILSI